MALSWAGAHDVTGVLVDITLLLGAVAAVLKFRLFNLLGHRWHSTLECAHYDLPDRSILFTADYIVTNRGQRPLRLRAVSLRLVRTRREGVLLLADETRPLAERVIRPSDPGMRGNLQIEPGERTIFTLRATLPELPDAVFVLCALDPLAKRPFTTFRGFYSRWPPSRRVSRRSGSQQSSSDAAAGEAHDPPEHDAG
jgi:hypothetical protein